MSEPIDPAASVPEGREKERRHKQRRRTDRRQSDRRKSAKLPVPAGPPSAQPSAGAAAAFAAQLIGQDGVKRGLKGGPPVLERARAAYLETEWMGSADRRRPAGKSARTDV